MKTMRTLSEVTNALNKEGYTVDFNLKSDHSDFKGDRLQHFPEEFIIDKYYRFEGPSDPADEAIVYAISSEKNNIKGILIDGYGISGNPVTEKLINTLKEKSPGV